MQKVEFYIVPIENLDCLNTKQITDFSDLLKQIEEKDLVLIPNEFFEEKDINGMVLWDLKDSSEKRLLTRLICKHIPTEECYSNILSNLKLKETALTGIKDNYHEKYHTEYTVCDRRDIPKVKRIFIKRYATYEEFITRVKECYPDLIFHEKCFDSIRLLGSYKENIIELDRNLSALNDHGAESYREAKGNEAEAIRRLESKCSVTCSGKGSNEDKPYKIEYILKKKVEKESKEKIELTCNPHLKLFGKRTDKRIYFCWGREEIEEHKIIVAKIGDHGL